MQWLLVLAGAVGLGAMGGCTQKPGNSEQAPAAKSNASSGEHALIADTRADVRVMTFNIRYAGGDKGEHAWVRRRDAVAERIRAADPDLLGLQEVEAVQADWIRERFPAYAFHGVGRVDGVRKGEFAPILYRADRYELLEAGHFWISTTPDVPGSKSWNTACERMASWVRLRDRRTTEAIVVINTHLDHVSAEAREKGVEMIRERAEQLSRASLSSETDAAACPVIITGDFNTSADGPLGEHLLRGAAADWLVLRDAYRVVDTAADGDEATFNNWTPREQGDRIDWIFTSSTFEVVAATIDRRMPEGVLASDHYPVTALLRPIRSGGGGAK